jgi:GMP synthase-like glutamine amidotransferase
VSKAKRSSNGEQALRVCLVDMNNGVDNQGIRCFKGLIRQFFQRVRVANPRVETELLHVQPRNLGEVPPDDCALYISSGGPGSPFDGYDEPWCLGYRKLLDGLVTEGLERGDAARGSFVVCFSYELVAIHLDVAIIEPRPTRKFGIMPVYMTESGMASPLLSPFGDRLFAWEHRSWQAVDLDEEKLDTLRGELWARESRDGVSKGPCLLALRFAPNIEGTIFHPEADRAGALAWISRSDQAQEVIEAYGEITYLRMLKTLDDPMRLARTYALLVPRWLARRFNGMAQSKGWNRIDPPMYDETTMTSFGKPPGDRAVEPAGRPELPREGT